MFTGIVTSVGRVATVDVRGDVHRLVIDCDLPFEGFEIGASVACAGICLTVTELLAIPGGVRFAVDAGPETLRLTTAGAWRPGTRINLERSLKVGDELGGHFVAGHVDGLAEIIERTDYGSTVGLRFAAPDHLAAFIATKGSVALDGTSLTVNDVEGSLFDCLLIPHTLKVTTWDERLVGDQVNLEVDTLARYVARLAETLRQD